MKLVIDIPENVKERFTSGVTCVNDMQILAEALIDGKPIPTDAVDRVTIKAYLESFEVVQQKIESSSVFQNKWISLDEKEPKDGQLIFVTFVNMYDKRYVRIAEFREEVYRKYDGKIDQRYYGFHSVGNIYSWGDKAVAWMPLPEPYKQEVEND